MPDIYGFPNDDLTAIVYEIDNDDSREKRLPSGRRGRKFNVQDILDQGGIPCVTPVLDKHEKLGVVVIGHDNYTHDIEPWTQDEIDNELAQTRQEMIVTPWQFRKALNQLGLRGQVAAFIATADQDTKDGWEVASNFERMHPLVDGMKARFNMTDNDMDNLFRLAATL